MKIPIKMSIKQRNLELALELGHIKHLPKEERVAAGMKVNKKIAILKEEIRNEEIHNPPKEGLV